MDERGSEHEREPRETADVKGPWPHCSLHVTRFAKFKGIDDQGHAAYFCDWCGLNPPATVLKLLLLVKRK